MKISAVDVLQADAGWRLFSFVKITTDAGIVGWSEYNESFGSAGLGEVIRALSPLVIGHDPLRSEFLVARLHVLTRQSRGGLNHQAIAALENALLDVRGKALNVPVYALFGGPCVNASLSTGRIAAPIASIITSSSAFQRCATTTI